MFYDKYKDHGTLVLAIPAVSFMVLINATGVLANTLLVVITVSSKNLRSTTNYLLAMQCFFDSLHALAHFYLAYVLYSGKNFDTLSDCLHIVSVPLIGATSGMALVFFTAFDRLFAAFFPVKHQLMNKLLYLGSIMAMCIGYSIYILYLGYLNAEKYKNTMVVCLITEGIHRSPRTMLSYVNMGLVSGSTSIYIAIGFTIYCKSNFNTTTRKLFKSLIILCVLMVCSWAFTSVSAILCFNLGLSDELCFFILLYTGITIHIACASNFFVLTRYSNEYRSATRRFFKKLGFTIFKPISGNSKISNKPFVHRPNISIFPKR